MTVRKAKLIERVDLLEKQVRLLMEREIEMQRNFRTLTRHCESLAAVVQYQLQTDYDHGQEIGMFRGIKH